MTSFTLFFDCFFAKSRLNRNADKLHEENRELRKRLEKYEKPPKDSGNSSTPPAKESIPAQVTRRTRSRRQKPDKSAGGQLGHEGTTRKVDAARRAAKVLEERLGDFLKKMIAVSDRHGAYFKMDFLDNQICPAHLPRNLEYLNDLGMEQTWAKDVRQLRREAIHARNEKHSEVIPSESWLERLDNLLRQNPDHLKRRFSCHPFHSRHCLERRTVITRGNISPRLIRGRIIMLFSFAE